uniref:Uncharacterized protein n=1 Tax=Myoviridae sp. ctOAa14 TaxID=2826646 RepID=A0A8S5MQP1_9CAUD|nr:MAG TPA: hypothetical protein [Myoviridae sp. ctOAa14]
MQLRTARRTWTQPSTRRPMTRIPIFDKSLELLVI